MMAARPLVDTHAHPMDPELQKDLAGVLGRAAESGIVAIVCVGYDLASSEAAVELARREPMLYAAVGIHPNYVGAAKDSDLKTVEQLAAAPKVVAIGETGLDYFREFSAAAQQRAWFVAHLDMARRLSLPVIVHNRDADDDTISALEQWGDRAAVPAGVLHCFSGDVVLMERAVAADLMISFAGPVTFKNARALPNVARAVPADRFVVETDSPYLAPHPMRGSVNEPARVRLVVERLAELRGCSVDDLALQTSMNAAALFPLLRERVGGVA